jgi:hypothetical protein
MPVAERQYGADGTWIRMWSRRLVSGAAAKLLGMHQHKALDPGENFRTLVSRFNNRPAQRATSRRTLQQLYQVNIPKVHALSLPLYLASSPISFPCYETLRVLVLPLAYQNNNPP